MADCRVLLFLLLGFPFAQAQTSAPVSVSTAEATRHPLQHPDPVYPAIARAAQVQGSVVIQILVDETGHIASKKLISGPPMLLAAALDAVKQWQFAPFTENGHPVPAITTLTIPFVLPSSGHTPEQDAAAQAYFPLFDQCQSALQAQHGALAVQVCREALNSALKTGEITSSDNLSALDAYERYGAALLMTGRLDEALAAKNQAIAVAKKCLTDSDEEFAWPFFWRSAVEARMGQVNAASADLTTTEQTIQRALAHLPDAKTIYTRDLARVLTDHAALLDSMGESDQAAKLRSEAASLQKP